MKKIKARIEQGFESSAYKTPEFTRFANDFRKTVRKILKNAGCSDIEFNTGHFYVSFCFTQNNGQTWYGSIGDVRSTSNLLYIRRTKSYKDCRGDRNINIFDIEEFEDVLTRTLDGYKDQPLYR